MLDLMVSICIPVYNGAAYLEPCLLSVLNQTFSRIEVVLVNDCSSDDSASIISHYARNDSRIRVHHNSQRLGLVGNWNRCVELAKSDWIKYLFQDDLLDNNCVESLYRKAESTNSRFCFCQRRFLFPQGCSQGIKNVYEKHRDVLSIFYGHLDRIQPTLFGRAISEDLTLNIVGEPTATLIHRSLFQEYGYFDHSLIQYCDAAFWSKTLTNTGSAYVAEPLASFRVHFSSATANNTADRYFRSQELDPLILLCHYLTGHHYKCLRKYIKSCKGPSYLFKHCSLRAYRAWRNVHSGSIPWSTRQESRSSEWRLVCKRHALITFLIPFGFFYAQLAKRHNAWPAKVLEDQNTL